LWGFDSPGLEFPRVPRLALRLGSALKIQGEFVYPSSSGDHNSRRDSSDFARLISAIHRL
jgi:hypothetical protein